MFDFPPPRPALNPPAAPVLMLSNPFGTTREWDGIAQFLGPRAQCEAFSHPSAFARRIRSAPYGAHLVAHGSGAFHALHAAIERPHTFRSLTLVDPDIICALPSLRPCPQFRSNIRLIQRVEDAVATRGQDAAAAEVIAWWMGRRAWTRTAPRLRARFSSAIPSLIADWQAQSRTPFDLLGLVALTCPVKVVTGRRAPAAILALARTLRMAVPDLSMTLVTSARAASHLTDPHVTAPEIGNFIVSNDRGWHSIDHLAAA